MAIRGIDHIELIVRDVARHVEFFEKLGFKVGRKTSHHGDAVELQLPERNPEGKENGEFRTVFEIHSIEVEELPGINHIGFRCDDINETVADLKKKGLKFEQDPILLPASGRTFANLRDPDGWRIQLVDMKRIEGVDDPDHVSGHDGYRDKPDILN